MIHCMSLIMEAENLKLFCESDFGSRESDFGSRNEPDTTYRKLMLHHLLVIALIRKIRGRINSKRNLDLLFIYNSTRHIDILWLGDNCIDAHESDYLNFRSRHSNTH